MGKSEIWQTENSIVALVREHKHSLRNSLRFHLLSLSFQFVAKMELLCTGCWHLERCLPVGRSLCWAGRASPYSASMLGLSWVPGIRQLPPAQLNLRYLVIHSQYLVTLLSFDLSPPCFPQLWASEFS